MSASEDRAAEDRRVAERAQHLLPEEVIAGSDDPEAQARAVLDDSEARSLEATVASSEAVEHRTSDETVPPVDI